MDPQLSSLTQPSAPKAYQQSSEDCAKSLMTDLQSGLTTEEAKLRFEKFGANELDSQPPIAWWRKLLAQFLDVLVILLLIATAISTTIWWFEKASPLPFEAMAILFIVIANALLGFAQRMRAESAVAALKKMVSATGNVIRNGQILTIPSTEIVVGDLLQIEEGDAIPADSRVTESIALQTSEASLTGESTPVLKETNTLTTEQGIADRVNMLFRGTTATSGRGKALVTATGMGTEMGNIATLLKELPTESTPLQVELNHVGKVLGIAVLVIAGVVIATILIMNPAHSLSQLFDVLIIGVALAVAAVPEGLPAMVTAVLSLGVRRMAKRNAIIRHLSAVETLGSASIIASDKTGTLTRNEMTVKTVVTASGRTQFEGIGYKPEGAITVSAGTPLEGPIQVELQRILTVADRSNNASLHEVNREWKIQGDPTEAALLVASRKAGFSGDAHTKRFARVAEVPFTSDRKLMSTVHTDTEQSERLLVFTKGAPDILLSRCTSEFSDGHNLSIDEPRRNALLSEIETLASEGLRTLGVALREIPRNALNNKEADASLEEGLVFLGIVGMIDPPRAEAKSAISSAQTAGIRPIMITGDHPRTAAVIAMELGISKDQTVVSGSDLTKASEAELEEMVATSNVYARISPEQKLRIIKALQKKGSIVAMTGDGVNDAPALRTANIGIAMGLTGTDVSKEASDVILTDDNYATILSAVEEGRAIYGNIRKFLRYLLSSNIGEVLTMFLGLVFAKQLGLIDSRAMLHLPLLATQILWTNLVTDGAPALALGVDTPENDLMKQPPRPHQERVITPSMWRGIVWVGFIISIGTLGVLDFSLPGGFFEGKNSFVYAQTMAFTTLVFFQLFNAFNARSKTRSAFRGFFRNGWLWGATALSVALQVAVVHTPVLQSAFSTTSLSLEAWMLCVVVASSVLWISEITKFIAQKRLTAKRQPSGTPQVQP